MFKFIYNSTFVVTQDSVQFSHSVQFSSISFIFKSDWGPDIKTPVPYRLPMWKPIPGPLLTTTRVRPQGHRSSPLGRMILLCPNYLYADVSDGEDSDLSRHQQEVTGGQLVMMSLVPGTVDSNVVSECHLCCPPNLPVKVSTLDSS